MKNKDVLVSVYCLTYNHERYIRHTLDGFVMQKTDFRFEVIVHDDASTDSTPDIVKEYEEKYPQIIKTIYQTQNQYSKGIHIFDTFIYPMIQGKYTAICEGDDYWTDPEKLQKQLNLMEQNSDISLCVHKVRKINENGTATNKYYPNSNVSEGKVSPLQYMELELVLNDFFHTSSFFYRTAYYTEIIEQRPEFFYLSLFSDFLMKLYFITKGSIYYFSDEMSCYRMCSISSVSRPVYSSKEKLINHLNSRINSLKSYNVITDYIFHKEISFGITMRELQIANLQNKAVDYSRLCEGDNRDIYLKQSMLYKLKLQTKVCFPSAVIILRKLKAKALMLISRK